MLFRSQSFKQAADAKEQEQGRDRLKRTGMELIKFPRPARATVADVQRAERALDRSARILMGMGA